MKTDYQIEIELLSDLCVADGGVYNSALDIDICRDRFGFPYIPAKRLRGCLRECAMELNDWGETIAISVLFGDKDEKEAKLYLGNAYLEQYDVMKQAVIKYHGNAVLHEQNILNHFSYIRTQTAIDYETGVAEEKSLRTMRVVNKGLRFYADVTLCADEEKAEEYEKQLAWCCKALRHIGMARTRGLGEVKVSLKKQTVALGRSDVQEKEFVKEDSYTEKNADCLKYTLFLEEPIVCKTVQAGEMKTMDYIEGGKILGLLAQKLKDSGKQETFSEFMAKGTLCCTNAYPAWNGRRMTEVPACFYAIKNNKKEYVDKAYESWKTTAQEDAEKTVQLNAMKHCYVWEQEEGIQKYSVDIERRYHHRRPEDKSIGRAVETGRDSNFHQISAIAAGQSFSGYIYGSEEQIKEIYDLLKREKWHYIGASKHSEYGKTSFTELNICNSEKKTDKFEKTNDTNTKEYLLVRLEAPTILYNDKAMCSTDAEVLIEEVNAVLGLPKEVRPEKQYINYTTIGGFQVTWGYRKPTLDVFDKGTVLLYELQNSVSCPAVAFLGERAEEGYGEFSVRKIEQPKPVSLGSWRKIYKQEDVAQNVKINLANLEHTERNYIQSICEDLLQEFIRVKAAKAAKERLPQASWKATVSNMLLMCKETNNVDMIKKYVKERYEKTGAGKDKKREIAEDILAQVDKNSEKLIMEFEELYGIEGLSEHDVNGRYQYLEAYLLELKYYIRSLEQSKNKKEETANE